MRGTLPVVLALAGGLAAQQTADEVEAEPENSFHFDIYRFSQDDNGGQELRREDFEYYALRGGLTMKLDDERTLRLLAHPAFIENPTPGPLPSTVINGGSTSASGDLATLDSLLAVDIAPEGSRWTYSPALFYHHQIDYIGAGFDFGATRDFARNGAQFAFNYAFRHDFLELNYWDRSYRGSDIRVSNNFMLSWAQDIGPDWRGSFSAQYSRQDGFLSDQHNFVTLEDGAGTPVLLVDEVLPNHRDRVQLNSRIKYSPAVGYSLGLNGSHYTDNWELEHWAVEPNAHVSLGAGFRLTAWWRHVEQTATEYFAEQPVAVSRFQTQDSDLGNFRMEAPGLTLAFPLGDGDGYRREGSFTLYGFDRSDGIEGLGAKLQFVWRW